MNFIKAFISCWLIIGGLIILIKQIPYFKKLQIIKAKIINWNKHRNSTDLIEYYPIIEYYDTNKKVILQNSLNIKGSNFYWNPKWINIFNSKNIIWIVIDENNRINYLSLAIINLLLPIGMIIAAIILIASSFI